MSEHTPGPWTATTCYISGPNQEHIATMNYEQDAHDICQANASLVASAPDLIRQRDALLGACEMMLETAPVRNNPTLIVWNIACERAKAAIEKAKGKA